MKQVIVAVFDQAVGGFSPASCVKSEGAAIRMFSDEVNRPSEDSVLYRHSEQFSLYKLGEFDDESGQVDGCLPVVLVTGSAVKT